MSQIILYYLIFVSQIFVISHYYPNKVLKRMRFITTSYPPTDYPKLYPHACCPEGAKRGSERSIKRYRSLNLMAIFVGAALLGFAAMQGYVPDGKSDMVVLVSFTMVQFIPMFYLEISEFKSFKKMRQNNKASTRTAGLKPRRLFDYISPVVGGVAGLLVIAALWLNMHFNAYDLEDSLPTIAAIVGVHLYFAGVVWYMMHGKKMNPHQDNKDREMHIEGIVKMATFTSIMISLFLLATELIRFYSLDAWETVSLSIYFQLLAVFGLGTMLNTYKVEDTNFEVYRADIAKV